MNNHVILGIALLLQAQAAPVSGAISSGKKSMTPIDTVAVWDPAKGELRVSLMPFKIEKKHLADIQKDRTMMAVLGGKGPGSEVKFKITDPAKGQAGVESYHFWAYGIEKENFTDNVSYSGDRARETIKKLVLKVDAKGGTFELEFEGKTAFDDGMAWKVSAKGKVLPPQSEK